MKYIRALALIFAMTGLMGADGSCTVKNGAKQDRSALAVSYQSWPTSAVPEPSGMLLFTFGGIFIYVAMRRGRK